MNIYIVGAITGIENWDNKFRRALLVYRTAKSENMKDKIITPMDYPEGKTQKEYMRMSCESVFWADKIIVTKDWENSMGTKAEIALAESYGLPVEYI